MSDTLTARLTSAHRRLVEPLTYDTETDCTRAVYVEMVDAYPDVDVRSRKADLHIADADQPWSNIEALVDLGIGEECVEGQPLPGRAHVVMGWVRLPGTNGPTDKGKGHTLLYFHPVDPGAPGTILEANVGDKLKRPWRRSETWGEIKGRYPAGVRVVALREP